MSLTGTLAEVRALANFLDAHAFAKKLDELRRGALPTSSVPGGSRSAEKPEPKTDHVDLDVDNWEIEFRQGINAMRTGGRRAERAQRAALSAMGQYVADPDPDEARRAMDRAIEKATEQLIDTAQGKTGWACDNCGAVYKKRTPQCRPKSGRCPACYQYWVDHGRTEERPKELWDREIDRQLARPQPDPTRSTDERHKRLTG